jgi:hypothetical protein
VGVDEQHQPRRCAGQAHGDIEGLPEQPRQGLAEPGALIDGGHGLDVPQAGLVEPEAGPPEGKVGLEVLVEQA